MTSTGIEPGPAVQGATVRVVQFTDWGAAGTLRSEWEALLGKSAAATIFQSWEWMTSWWAAYGQNCELCLLALYQADGLIAIAPLYCHGPKHALRTRPRRLRLIGDRTGDSANLDLLYATGRHSEAVAGLASWLAARADMWDTLDMESVPSESPLLAELTTRLAAMGWSNLCLEWPHLVIVLPATWEEFLSRFSGKRRRYIGYARRRLQAKHQLVVCRCETTGQLRYFLDALYRLHGLRWQKVNRKGVFCSPQRRVFYEVVSEKLLQAGRLNFWLLELNGRPVAADFFPCFRGTTSAVQGGWDPEYAVYGVGQVLTSYELEKAIEEGYRAVDCLEGDNAYKLDWTAETRKFKNMIWFRPWTRGALCLRIHELLECSRNVARKIMPTGVWAVVRKAVRRVFPYRDPIEEPETRQ